MYTCAMVTCLLKIIIHYVYYYSYGLAIGSIRNIGIVFIA